jgi:hypothetical protein
MKQRWRRIVVLTASCLLALVLLILGALAWLHTSGRLAMLAQHLLYRLSGQEITFETIAFPSWTTVVVTKVHLQQQLPGWRLVLDCPRLEAHYGVVGLVNMQVTDLYLQQPQIDVSASDAPPSVPPPSTTALQPALALPFKQLHVQQGTLRVHWRDQTYLVQQLAAVLRSQGGGRMRFAAQGSLPDSTTIVNAPPILTPLTLEGSGDIDLQRQRLTISQLTGTLPQVGSIRGSGIWHWASHTVQELRLQLDASDITPLWGALKERLPAATGGWQTTGQWDIQLHAARLSLRPRQVQGLTVTWQVHNGTLRSAEGTYASEHLNGTLEAVMTIDEAAGQYTLQGTLTLQPFALLIGSLFLALEENHLTSVVTFSADYSAHTERLQLYVAGQWHDLGMLTLRGTVQQPRRTPRYDLQMQARHVNLARLWRTLVHDPLLFPTLSQAQVQGNVNVMLDVLPQSSPVVLRGTVDVAEAQFHTATIGLHGLSLLLPVQLQYPLPQTALEVATLPPESFGRLSLETLQIGNVDMHDLSFKLALWSDNIFVPDAVSMPLLGGQMAIDQMTLRHLLQPHRQLTLPLRLHHIDLQQLQRGTATLPVAGILDGDFSSLQVHGDRLKTHGALTLQVAGGVVRISDLHGSEVFSALPTFGCSVTTEAPLSLLRLTDIYPIGDIGGTLHFSISDLTFMAQQPATFVLEFAVQEQGGEKREITLRALNNLLFTTGAANVATDVLGDTYRLPYRRFGAVISLRDDTLQLRGKYHDSDGTEYFMQAPLFGGVSIVNRVPQNGIPFRDFLQRLKSTVLEKPAVQVR